MSRSTARRAASSAPSALMQHHRRGHDRWLPRRGRPCPCLHRKTVEIHPSFAPHSPEVDALKQGHFVAALFCSDAGHVPAASTIVPRPGGVASSLTVSVLGPTRPPATDRPGRPGGVDLAARRPTRVGGAPSTRRVAWRSSGPPGQRPGHEPRPASSPARPGCRPAAGRGPGRLRPGRAVPARVRRPAPRPGAQWWRLCRRSSPAGAPVRSGWRSVHPLGISF